MKKRLLLVATTLLGVTTLASCGSSFNLSDATKDFKSSIDTTVSLTYKADFKTTVDAHGGTSNFSSFLRDASITVKADLDLGSDKYLKVTAAYTDALNTSTNFETTAILWKEDGKYYSQVNDENATEVSDVNSAISSLLKDASTTNVGWVDLNSLLYKTDHSYELNNFNLTDTFTVDDLEWDTSYEANETEGIKATTSLSYIGYKGDQGWFDLKNCGDAKAEVVTDNNGYVTSYTETLNNQVDLPIMTPAPTVEVNGSRSLTASYNSTFTKEKGDLTIKTTASFTDSENGSYTVTQFKNGDWANMTPVKDKDTLDLTKYLGIKPTAASGYEVDKVTVNDKETSIIAAGWYCFMPEEGKNVIKVTFKKSADAEITYATVNVTNENNVKYTLKRLVGQNLAGMVDITDGKIDTSESGVFGVIYIASSDQEEGKTYTVEVNGSATTMNFQGQYYCFQVSGTNTYNVVIKVA